MKKSEPKFKIGFIGQGYVGKNYADDFTQRGWQAVRYSLEPEYIKNKPRIKTCDIVFICVPTPTTPRGFDDSIVRSAVKLVGKGKTAVIKSTVLPGTTAAIQKDNPNIFILVSPEFLTATTAAYDAAHPNRNIIGLAKDNKIYRQKAKAVLAVLPQAPYEIICAARAAELIKYAGNCLAYAKVIYINLLYDLVVALGADWQEIKEALLADPRIGPCHLDPVHKKGRGAGGPCFIKDFAAFANLYQAKVANAKGLSVLRSLQEKNIELLVESRKDIGLLRGVYGEDVV